MRYIITFFIALLHLSASAQLTRKAEIGQFTEKAYSAKEFRQIADSLKMSVSELSDYPVIFPIKNTTISSGFGMRSHPIYNDGKYFVSGLLIFVLFHDCYRDVQQAHFVRHTCLMPFRHDPQVAVYSFPYIIFCQVAYIGK